MLKETNLLKVKETFKTLFLAVEIEPLLGGLVIQHPFSNSPDNYMLKAIVKKEDMICYLNSRGEDEIVVDTRHIISEKI